MVPATGLTQYRHGGAAHLLLKEQDWALLLVYLCSQGMNVYGYSSALPILNIDWSVSPGAGARLQSPLAAVGHSLVSDNSGVAVLVLARHGAEVVVVLEAHITNI